MRPYINEATTNFIEFYKHFSFLKCCDCGVAEWSRLVSEVTVASDITIKYVKAG